MARGVKSDDKPAKKTKSAGGSKRKGGLTPYNKYMKTELARLKEEKPDLKHAERFKIAAQNWHGSKEGTKAK